MGVVDTAFAVGDDALSYEFSVAFGTLDALNGTSDLNIRCQTVEIPTESRGTYTVDYKSESFNKPNGKNTTAKQFSITFRIDKYWTVYQAFRNWANTIVSESTGGAAIDSVAGVSSIRTPITITSGYTDIDGDFTATDETWAFTGCWPSSVGNPTLDNSSGDPATVTVTFEFLSMN